MLAPVIKGCRLIVHSDRKTLWGDLFKMDNHGPWILVGALNGRGKADWKRHKRTRTEPTLHVDATSKYFESRGVVVIPEQPGVFLNYAARRWLSEDHPDLSSMALPEDWEQIVKEGMEIINGSKDD